MKHRLRWVWITLAGLTAMVLILAVAGALVLRSDWFRNKVRERIVAEVEKATGGRVEIGTFYFDWSRMQAQVDGFALHGTEPPGTIPLFQAQSAKVGIKIISAFRRPVDVRSLL